MEHLAKSFHLVYGKLKPREVRSIAQGHTAPSPVGGGVGWGGEKGDLG